MFIAGLVLWQTEGDSALIALFVLGLLVGASRGSAWHQRLGIRETGAGHVHIRCSVSATPSAG